LNIFRLLNFTVEHPIKFLIALTIKRRLKMNTNQAKLYVWKLYEKLNGQFFGGACCVLDVQFARFGKDYELFPNGGITLGRYCPNSRVVLLNYYFLFALQRDLFKEEIEIVLLHEMVHAYLANSLTPTRFGMYDWNHHGADFRKEESRIGVCDGEVQYVTDCIGDWMSKQIANGKDRP
jgi:hypothetical protein